MAWQRQVADVALEVDPDTGRLAYRTVVLLVPRQSGKTTLKMALRSHRALSFGGHQRITETAQTRRDAVERWLDEELPLLVDSPLGRLFQPRRAKGLEAMLWRTGSISNFVASTKKAGHGRTLDLAIVDEAFAQRDHRLEQALRPPMITRPEPQLWAISTGGDEGSVWLRHLAQQGRRAAEADRGHGIAYFEWSADPTADPADPATWWSCMPALGVTVTEDAVRAEYEAMDLAEFQRAYLNIWPIDLADVGHDAVIPLDAWDALCDPDSTPLDPVTFAVDVAPDGTVASIAAVGFRDDGLRHVELVDHRPGTRWVVDRLVELAERYDPATVALVPTTQAGALLGDLDATDLPITRISAADYAAACASFVADALGDPDGEHGPRLVHIGQHQLADAIEGARRRTRGETWTWDRASTAVDLTPLVAATVALQAHTTAPPPGPVFAW